MDGESNCPIKPGEFINCQEERDRVASGPCLSNFQRRKLDKDSRKNWDLFYKRNGDRFFKNRYWTRHEFSELCSNQPHIGSSNNPKLVLEIGCGCGDFVFPLLDEKTYANELFVYCCDISPIAIDIIKSKPLYKQLNPHRMKAFVADITENDQTLIKELEGKQVDMVSLVFVLSAIDPTKMERAIQNMHKALKPNGLVLFRDYAIYDQAMMRFKADSKICDQFYVRQDGTRAYFFEKEQLKGMFEMHNFTCQSIDYINRETVNNASGDRFSRRFLQGKFRSNERVSYG